MKSASCTAKRFRTSALIFGSDWRAGEFRDEAMNWALFASTRRRMRIRGGKFMLPVNPRRTAPVRGRGARSRLPGAAFSRCPHPSMTPSRSIPVAPAGRSSAKSSPPIRATTVRSPIWPASLIGCGNRIRHRKFSPTFGCGRAAPFISALARSHRGRPLRTRAEFIMAAVRRSDGALVPTSAALMDRSHPGRIHQLKARSRFKRRRNGSCPCAIAATCCSERCSRRPSARLSSPPARISRRPT